MKRVLLIILAVVGIVVILGVAFAGLASRNSMNRSLEPSYAPSFGMGGGGAPATQAPAAVEAPAPDLAYDATGNAVKSVESSTGSSQAVQERMVIYTADLAIVGRAAGFSSRRCLAA